MTYLQAVCDIGPRMSGSRAMTRQQELIKKHFEDLGAKVQFQTWNAETRGSIWPGCNGSKTTDPTNNPSLLNFEKVMQNCNK